MQPVIRRKLPSLATYLLFDLLRTLNKSDLAHTIHLEYQEGLHATSTAKWTASSFCCELRLTGLEAHMTEDWRRH